MTVEQTLCGRTLRYQPLTARTPDGLCISVQDHGRPNIGGRDILFIHGFSQSSLCWLKQVSGRLRDCHRLVTYDMRGHGASDKPLDPVFYRDPERWADEVQSVIDCAGLHRPIIVCWSYAGRVALDFLGKAGGAAISGLVMVASTSTAEPYVLGPATPKLRAMTSAADLVENVAAVRALLDACSPSPLPGEEFGLMLGYNLLVPVPVRLAMTGRDADYSATLAALDVPVLAIHGAQDSINLLAMSEYSLSQARDGTLRLYEHSGHLPFWDENARFDSDLLAFAGSLGQSSSLGDLSPPSAGVFS